MSVTLLLPELDHPAIEERYAARQTELLLRRDTPIRKVIRFNPSKPVSEVLAGVESELVFVATSNLIAPPRGALALLQQALDKSGADAAVASLNDPDTPLQQGTPARLYLSLRQFEQVASEVRGEDSAPQIHPGGDPVVFLAHTDRLRNSTRTLPASLDGMRVAVARNCFVHRFASQRGQLRDDLLARVDRDARNILEFGCGEGALGAAVKARQNARVTGIELDREAAAIAATRLDRVVGGDVRTLIDDLDESFDFIVGGDIVEHLDDPWQFLTDLRKVARPDAKLLLSLPNVANWSVVSDLLVGRFDYVYLGILCAGHLRFFTRRSIEEMLTMAGWECARIESQEPPPLAEFEDLKQKLDVSGIQYSADDLLAPGWYVTAVNRS